MILITIKGLELMIMIIANGTVANDRVNKYGERLLPEAIFSAYQQQWMDVFPYSI